MDLKIFQTMNKQELRTYIEFLLWNYRVMDAFWFIRISENFARVIDDRIRVECVFAPPDPHPEDLFCKWRFTLNE